jgi:hypothetical protein
LDELKAARELRPDAVILGVKFAASLVPEIQHVWTQHGEMTLKIKAAAGRPITVHARPRFVQSAGSIYWHIPKAKESFEAIDYHWPKLDFAKGSSGIAGAMWARHGMGFDEVIMAGINLNTDDKKYADGYPNRYQYGISYATDNSVENWLRLLQTHIANGKTDGIYSMGGNTQKLLGAPC